MARLSAYLARSFFDEGEELLNRFWEQQTWGGRVSTLPILLRLFSPSNHRISIFPPRLNFSDRLDFFRLTCLSEVVGVPRGLVVLCTLHTYMHPDPFFFIDRKTWLVTRESMRTNIEQIPVKFMATNTLSKDPTIPLKHFRNFLPLKFLKMRNKAFYRFLRAFLNHPPTPKI